jgi:hypothetical protein
LGADIGSHLKGLYDGDIQMIDSSSIRVHQHAANAQKRWPIPLHGSLARRADDEIHALVDAFGLPVMLKLTEGQAHDGRSAADMLGGLARAISCWPTAPMTATPCAPVSPNVARGPASNHAQPEDRSRVQRLPLSMPQLVERFFNKLKHFRAVATRYDKRDDNFLASVQLASIRIWLRHNGSVA